MKIIKGDKDRSLIDIGDIVTNDDHEGYLLVTLQVIRPDYKIGLLNLEDSEVVCFAKDIESIREDRRFKLFAKSSDIDIVIR